MTIEEFRNIDLRVANIISAERVERSEKLVKLQVLAGDTDSAGQAVPRQVVAGIGKAYEPEALVGKRIVIVANLDPRTLMGFESRGMVLAAHDENGNPVIVSVAEAAPAGSKIS
ncbi:MAG: methionine--tRNA ligase subunit beta [Patescibacteria group bacterium]